MKIRFIIEKQNSYLKNLKALDHIRNTVAGHIQIDYRIACAMYNFNEKPCCPDGNHAVEIAQKIRESTKIKMNKLEFLLHKQLNTQDFVQVNLNSVDDFVSLNPNIICREILLGTYQLGLSKSYIKDLLDNGVAYLTSDKYMRSILKKHLASYATNQNSKDRLKIIAVEIASRHKRSQKAVEKEDQTQAKVFRNVYKIFILYESKGVGSESIRGTSLLELKDRVIYLILKDMCAAVLPA